MSTTFGVEVSYLFNKNEKELIEVAFRSSTICFTNPLAQLLPDTIPVIAMDNTNQGINTIGDIKKKILEHDGG